MPVHALHVRKPQQSGVLHPVFSNNRDPSMILCKYAKPQLLVHLPVVCAQSRHRIQCRTVYVIRNAADHEGPEGVGGGV